VAGLPTQEELDGSYQQPQLTLLITRLKDELSNNKVNQGKCRRTKYAPDRRGFCGIYKNFSGFEFFPARLVGSLFCEKIVRKTKCPHQKVFGHLNIEKYLDSKSNLFVIQLHCKNEVKSQVSKKEKIMHRQAVRKMVITLVLLLIVTSVSVPINSTALAAGNSICFKGSSKGLTYFNKEWHHYVQFNVDLNGKSWWVSGPVPSSVWGDYSDKVVRAGYTWPGDWADPFPASSFTLCRHSSSW
jgi:hypothetical protein